MESSDSEPSHPKKRFKCSIPGCSASFTKSRKLLSHVRRHTGERPFACDEDGCNKTYTNSSHLRRHKKMCHGEKESETVLCEFEGCSMVLANKYSLKKHYSRKHNPEKYPFICNDCNKRFERKVQLLQHTYVHTGEAPFSCDACNQSFMSSKTLSKHKRYHCTYTCDCKETFDRWSLMVAHKKSCHKPSYKCETCGKTFSHKGNFEDHKTSHMDKSEKQVFMCSYPECNTSYFYKRNLDYHIKHFHEKINADVTFKCTYPKCLVVLKSKLYLKRHLQKHFEWTEKKARKPRKDKGIPKKSMKTVLLGEDTEEKENDESTKVTSKEDMEKSRETSERCHPEEITDDDLINQCDLTLDNLQKKLIAAV